MSRDQREWWIWRVFNTPLALGVAGRRGRRGGGVKLAFRYCSRVDVLDASIPSYNLLARRQPEYDRRITSTRCRQYVHLTFGHSTGYIRSHLEKYNRGSITIQIGRNLASGPCRSQDSDVPGVTCDPHGGFKDGYRR